MRRNRLCQETLKDVIGRLFIDWGPGALAWVQYADRKDKPVTELRTAFREADFPGFLNFIQPLSKLDSVPKSWIAALQSCRGIYLLTCPKTKEQYVAKIVGILDEQTTYEVSVYVDANDNGKYDDGDPSWKLDLTSDNNGFKTAGSRFIVPAPFVAKA